MRGPRGGFGGRIWCFSEFIRPGRGGCPPHSLGGAVSGRVGRGRGGGPGPPSCRGRNKHPPHPGRAQGRSDPSPS